jgi:amino acid adenylation domain-containing protein
MQNLDDIYELSPLQQGILFHSLAQSESGVYFVQTSLTLQGRLDPVAFQCAWQTVVDRHASLRSSFHWGKLSKPLQVVHKHVKVSMEALDWRTLPESEKQQRLDSLLESDRRRGFDLSKPPLMHLMLVKTGEHQHEFIWSFHHLLLDGWSSSLVFQEVAALYETSIKGQLANLRSPRSFKEYIVWLQEQDLFKAEAFWRESLKDFDQPTVIAVAGASASSADENSFGEQWIKLPTEVTERIKSFARQQQLTINTLVQGAWALLLNRYSGDEDVLFGVTVSGRPADLPGAEEIVGLLINTLPARVKLRFDAPIHTWLREIQNHQLEMRQYEYSPLVEIQGWSSVQRGRPLFQSVVIFENHRVGGLMTERELGFEITRRLTIERTNYPLAFAVLPGAEIELGLLYDCGRFESQAICRMLSYLQYAIEKMVSHPNQELSEVGTLIDTEAEQIIGRWNSTASPYSDDTCAHELIQAQVGKTPDAIALVLGDQQVTYAELNRRASQLAHYLQSAGVKPEATVALFMRRSVELVIGLLGILKAGAAYLAVDPTYPPERVAYMLENSGVSLVLTHLTVERSISSHAIKTLRLDSDWELVDQCCEDNPSSGVLPGNLAYLIYTSGSTGVPKVVAVQHQGLCNLSEAQVRTFSNQSSDRVLQFASLSFDASIFEIMMSLAVGACLCLVEEDSLLPGPGLSGLLQDLVITNATLPPSTLQAMPDSDLPALRTLVVAGEACSSELVRRWSGPRVFNAYGPTETTVWATVAECSNHDLSVPIGKPICNTQDYLLNSKMSPVPIGVPGELSIGGVGLARGYLNRSDLTAERFVPDPFSKTPGARLYRTGDLARYLPDGNIVFIGRIDYQVKIRGYRVELSEIESALSQHASVKQAAVVVRNNGSQEKRLIAYVVPRHPGKPRTYELRSFLSGKLPGYMVPSTFVLMKDLPVTRNGKVDRKGLPDPDHERPDIDTAYVMASTRFEEDIASVWKEILQIDKIGIHDNFFELGGHSLHIVRVHNKLKEVGDGDIAITDLFKYPTISSLASYLSDRTKKVDLQDHQERLRKIEEGRNRIEMQRLRKQAGLGSEPTEEFGQ